MKKDIANQQSLSSGEEVIERILHIIELYGSQVDFAHDCQLSKSTVSAIVRGKIKNPTAEILVKIKAGTSIKWEWLMQGTGQKFEEFRDDIEKLKERARLKGLEEPTSGEDKEARLVQMMQELIQMQLKK